MPRDRLESRDGLEAFRSLSGPTSLEISLRFLRSLRGIRLSSEVDIEEELSQVGKERRYSVKCALRELGRTLPTRGASALLKLQRSRLTSRLIRVSSSSGLEYSRPPCRRSNGTEAVSTHPHPHAAAVSLAVFLVGPKGRLGRLVVS